MAHMYNWAACDHNHNEMRFRELPVQWEHLRRMLVFMLKMSEPTSSLWGLLRRIQIEL